MVKLWQVRQISPMQLGRDYADLAPLKKWTWRSNSWGLTEKNALSEVCGNNIYHDTDPANSNRTIQSFLEKFSGPQLCTPISSDDKRQIEEHSATECFHRNNEILLKLGLGKEDGSLMQEAEDELKIFVQRYISALCENTDARLNTSLPVLSAFGIFDSLKVAKNQKLDFLILVLRKFLFFWLIISTQRQQKKKDAVNSSMEQLEVWTCINECSRMWVSNKLGT